MMERLGQEESDLGGSDLNALIDTVLFGIKTPCSTENTATPVTKLHVQS
jgi:hypothetical protein